MQKKWIILSILLVLLAVLLAPLIFTLYVNISDASIYYDVSITGLENRTVSEPVTIIRAKTECLMNYILSGK
ncbi:MAG: hypothetical protein O0X93_09830 [Methanocorpusculum sp.]|nr:hypothetical protein [Methanocorpusculum sp.]MDE2523433.1 hypothetical protein [Methanocorpusculum sp.]MDE2523573.1 hypothetical protein [Methanocorpusculum sp.]